MLNFNNIETVMLDMDGTLLDLHFDSIFWLEYVPRVFAEKNGISTEDARSKIFPVMIEKKGTIDWYCLEFWSAHLDLHISSMKHDLAHLIAPLPGVVESLDKLKKMGKQLLLVTNAHRDSLNLKMEKTGIDRYFDKMISAHDYRIPKESRLFWEALEKETGINKEKSVMIDDSTPVLTGAAAFGIKNLVMILKPDSTADKNPPDNRFICKEKLINLMPA